MLRRRHKPRARRIANSLRLARDAPYKTRCHISKRFIKAGHTRWGLPVETTIDRGMIDESDSTNFSLNHGNCLCPYDRFLPLAGMDARGGSTLAGFAKACGGRGEQTAP